jgi:hypothetical protein
MGSNDTTGLTTHQKIIENTNSTARYGNINPKKPINHHVDGFRYGARHDNKKSSAKKPLIMIKKRLKKLRATETAMCKYKIIT